MMVIMMMMMMMMMMIIIIIIMLIIIVIEEKLTALHERIAKQIDNISNREDIPKWMTLGKRVFFKKALVKKMLLIITYQYRASL